MPGFPIITTLGDLLIGGIAGIETRLPGNTTEDRQFLMSVGDGDDASAPEWTTVAITDVDGLSTALSGKASTTHTHAISDVTNLQTSLDAKASLSGAAFTGHVTVSPATNLPVKLTLKNAVGDTANNYAFELLDESNQRIFSVSGVGRVDTFGAGAATISWGGRVVGDSTGRVFIRSDGRYEVGDGTAMDLRLQRTAAKTWTIDDASGGNATLNVIGLLNVNGDTIRLLNSRTPASATATGNAGDTCWDANYIYVCIATNTWRRIAHSTW